MANRNYDFGGVQGPVQIGGGVQYTAGGSQYVAHGSQHVAGRDQVGSGGPQADLLAELASLRRSLAELRLTMEERQAAERELTAVEDVLRQDRPDPQDVGQHLAGFVQGLKDAGALVSAGTSLIESVKKVASWVGPLGVTVPGLL